MSDEEIMRAVKARSSLWRSAPKPANFDALTAAAAARDSDLFAAEHAKYADQAARAGAHPGQLLGVIDENGNVA